eukprot:9740050-Lingulodinium_polyedra.AAC.1
MFFDQPRSIPAHLGRVEHRRGQLFACTMAAGRAVGPNCSHQPCMVAAGGAVLAMRFGRPGVGAAARIGGGLLF